MVVPEPEPGPAPGLHDDACPAPGLRDDAALERGQGGWWKWVSEARIVVVDNVTTEAIRVTYTASKREASCD